MKSEINEDFGIEGGIDNKNRIIIPALIRERLGLVPQQIIFIQKVGFGKISISIKEPNEYISVVIDSEFRITLPKKLGLEEFFKAGKVRFLELKGGEDFAVYPSFP